MKKKESTSYKIIGFFKTLYIKLFKINDSPQKIALGLGIGVFSGIIPGMGPIGALVLAFILRANRASALLGSLLTNTWLSFLIFILSIKAGSVIIKVDWLVVRNGWMLFLDNYHWQDLFRLSVLKIILPVVLGYFFIALCVGFLVYLISWIIIIKRRHENKSGVYVSR